MKTETLMQSEGKSSSLLHELVAQEVLKSKPKGKVLDLGCGQGSFLKRLHGQNLKELHGSDGFKYEGVDSSIFQFSQSNLNQRLPYPDQDFEWVTAIEVVEHLENPRHLLREVSRILKPGGALLISTPNNECITSIISLLFRGHFSAFTDHSYPAHITPVIQTDLRRMLIEAGLIFDKVIQSNQGRIPGTNLHWQSIFPFLKGKLFSDNYIMLARKPYGN